MKKKLEITPNTGGRQCSLCGKTVRIDSLVGGNRYGIWVEKGKMKWLFHVYCYVPNIKEIKKILQSAGA
jgi:hypothetical protein